MDDIYLEVILRSEPSEIQKLCLSNKYYNTLCKNYREHISKTLLKRYQVRYKNPGNFIYIMNKKKYDPERSFHDIYKLYFKFYNNTGIDCDKKKIRSIPFYPNVKSLNCNENLLKSLPPLPNVETLNCRFNKLTSLPELPNVKILNCAGNQLRSLPELPKVTNLYCGNNKLTRLPELPNVVLLSCSNNQLMSLPNLPKLKTLINRNNPMNPHEDSDSEYASGDESEEES